MAIMLFEHNQKAYDSALALLASTGKAAVIHPTGTGKSFHLLQAVRGQAGQNDLLAVSFGVYF